MKKIKVSLFVLLTLLGGAYAYDILFHQKPFNNIQLEQTRFSIHSCDEISKNSKKLGLGEIYYCKQQKEYFVVFDKLRNFSLFHQKYGFLIESSSWKNRYGVHSYIRATSEDEMTVDQNSNFHIGDQLILQSPHRSGGRNFFPEVLTKIVDVSNSKIKVDKKLFVRGGKKNKFVFKFQVPSSKKKNRLKTASKLMVLKVIDDDLIAQNGSQQKNGIQFFGNSTLGNLQIDFSSPEKIIFNITRSYKSSLQIVDETIALQTNIPLAYLVRRNSKLVSKLPALPYRGKRAVSFGSKTGGWTLSEQSKMSSFRILSQKLDIFLDNMDDHPHRNIRAKGAQRAPQFEELSLTGRQEGELAHSRIVIFLKKDENLVPRIMHQPEGYLATHIWTEHADNGLLESNQAVYFGSEGIDDVKSAIGGFAKYGIPATKSIFYDNPDQFKVKKFEVLQTAVEEKRTDASWNIQSYDQVAWQNSKGFRKLITQLSQIGFEIVLHTAHPNPENAAAAIPAVKFMKNQFDMVTWIDHQMRVNRTAISADGLDSSTEFYMNDSWQDNNIRYFWNSASEDYTDSSHKYFSMYGHPSWPNYFYKTYWKNKNLPENIVTWAATGAIDLKSGYSKESLEQFVDDWGLFITHVYLTGVGKFDRRPYYKSDGKGKWIITDRFNLALENLKYFGDQGDLWNTTIRNLLDYQIATEKVQFSKIGEKSFIINNQNSKTIKGFSFALRSDSINWGWFKPKVNIENSNFKYKKLDEDTIFWFDLKPGQTQFSITN